MSALPPIPQPISCGPEPLYGWKLTGKFILLTQSQMQPGTCQIANQGVQIILMLSTSLLELLGAWRALKLCTLVHEGVTEGLKEVLT